MVKSEVDEILGPIGGMTRLVMNGSGPASPSASAHSPQSRHSSPLAPVIDYIALSDSSSGSTWQFPTSDIQPSNNPNFNVSMDVYPESFSPTIDMLPGDNGHIQPDDLRLLYGQHHLYQHGIHEIHPGMDMGAMPPAPQTQYYATLFGSSLYGQPVFGGQNRTLMQSNNIQSMHHNPQDSWQTFEAQYKP
jgi:hypothetical protein